MYLCHRRHILAWCKLSLHRSFSWTVHILFLYNHKCAWWWHSATLEMPLRLKNWEECRIPYWSVLYTSFLWFHITNIYRQLVKDCETQFWYILIREWSYAGISHDQSTPGDVFPSPNTQKNDDYEPSMWNSFFPKLIRDQHESQVDITGSPCHILSPF